MPSSFDALYDETRPLALIEPAPQPRLRPAAALASVFLVVLPVLAVVLF